MSGAEIITLTILICILGILIGSAFLKELSFEIKHLKYKLVKVITIFILLSPLSILFGALYLLCIIIWCIFDSIKDGISYLKELLK
jgi:hypothetical protein